MTTNIKFTNFAATTLASGISAGDTSIVLTGGTGALFPSLSGSNYFYGTLVDAATGNTKEIVKVTARSTDTLTATRAQDNTSASAFIAGDRFELRLTAASEETAVRTDEVVVSANKVLTVSNTLTLAGTDSTTMTFPSTSATIARTDAANTFTGDQSVTGDIILTGAGKGVIFEGTTADAHESTLLAGEPTSDVTITMPITTTTLAGLAVTQTFTVPQRGTVTTDNDLSFDLSATNYFKCTPTAGGALTFTNIADGQSGRIQFINGSNYAITAAANTKVTSTFLATISVTGNYWIHYDSDGTNVACSTAGAYA